MKKLLFLLYLSFMLAINANPSYADRGGYRGDYGRGHGHDHGHHRDYNRYSRRGNYFAPAPGYYAPAVTGYFAPPPVVYYQQPAPVYYPPAPIYRQRPQPYYYQQQQYNQDPRSHQGLAGGVIGSVIGYEIGSGDPIAAGLGAAAGSFFGNGIGR